MTIQHIMAPIKGLNTSVKNATGTTLICENFFPTTYGLEVRGGTILKKTFPDPIITMFTYDYGNISHMFVATNNTIYDYDTEQPVVENLTNGNWNTVVMMTTEAGAFMTIFNGVDDARVYDGNSWETVGSYGDIASNKIIYAWIYNNRQFMIERDSQVVWYLSRNAYRGDANKIVLGGVFNKSSKMFLGGTFSSDSGEGLDDRCLFINTAGEMALYVGSNPDEIDSWKLDGIYEIGRPIGTKAHYNIGGDFIVATDKGLIPVSSIFNKDPSQFDLLSLTNTIEPDWNYQIRLNYNDPTWIIKKWDSKNMLCVVPPNQDFMFVANTNSNAWTIFKGWNIEALELFKNGLYYGDENGNIFKCEQGGLDNGQPFEAKLCTSFINTDNNIKLISAVRGVWKFNTPTDIKHIVATDYNTHFPSVDYIKYETSYSHGVWDVSKWNEVLWFGKTNFIHTYKWSNSRKLGISYALQVKLKSTNNFKLDISLLSADFNIQTGGGVV